MARKNRRILFFLLLVSLTGGFATYLSRESILTRAGEYLVVSDPLQKADAIEILASGPLKRSLKAAELYRQGWAPRIVVTKDEQIFEMEELKHYNISVYEGHEIVCAVLKFHKVPAEVIEVLDGNNHGTWDEALKLRKYMQERSLKRLIVVTSNFHTRRTRMAFRRALRGTGVDVLVAAAPPDYEYNPHRWWTRKMDSRTLILEYQKLVFYAVRYW
jgi:uncharacterized SAM-binding protein YcdF (DUF218 family)